MGDAPVHPLQQTFKDLKGPVATVSPGEPTSRASRTKDGTIAFAIRTRKRIRRDQAAR